MTSDGETTREVFESRRRLSVEALQNDCVIVIPSSYYLQNNAAVRRDFCETKCSFHTKELVTTATSNHNPSSLCFKLFSYRAIIVIARIKFFILVCSRL